MNQLTKMNSWKKLEKHLVSTLLEPLPPQHSCISTEHITLDYSGQRVNTLIMDSLFDLANECHLKEQIDALMAGETLNNTENRPALHTALRALDTEVIPINQHNIVPDVMEVRRKMKDISDCIRNGEWLGFSNEPITDVVNIGIGGSMLGPFFCIRALMDFVTDKCRFHFISGIEPYAFSHVIKKLNPETTLFIISSKSFTTPETLAHFHKAVAWLGQDQHLDKHFIAVTAQVEKARELGFDTILPIWEWVGGRYSFCSAINLISCIAIGFERFSQILDGAHQMDLHFHTTPFSKNLPILLALTGIWNINFLNINNLLVMTYSHDLHFFVPWLQQLDMESNGKSVNKQGYPVDYNTGPIIWGGPGDHAQHSYYQHLCQGTHKIAADLICVHDVENNLINKLGNTHKEILSNGGNNNENPHSYIAGEMPLNLITLSMISPQALGALIALYEHKIFVQGIIWNINSFDQPGVESSKTIIRQNNWIS